ncbi:hypothetical protein SXCC_02831 [Gluconacetobacter sp. SXCC-1]|nr:hypothetical protein SXCC_02831 [Gluconacetobacter sp. SXCC-1]SAY46855.1 hypothetical protein KRIGEM_03214 [Komagataeibacter rhaeticus]SAY49937.1 hypothetical protein KRIGEM_02925 [Komagataeibacter rhaeticus]
MTVRVNRHQDNQARENAPLRLKIRIFGAEREIQKNRIFVGQKP